MQPIPADSQVSLYRGDRGAVETKLPNLHLLTRSPSYSNALAQLDRYATLDGVPVLLEGETGTGKSFFAHRLHSRSPRARRQYYHVNLAALEDALASSDLFGHLSGAFTGANQRRVGLFTSADGSSLFLDEIGQASLAVQRKLLHAVEYGEVWPVGSDRAIRVDVRVITATNRPLRDLVAEGRMLHDLVPRLASFRIRLPALRERQEDIGLLAEAILARDASRYGGYATPPSVAPALQRRLGDYHWPGNVRELEGVIRRMLADACSSRVLGADLLDDVIHDLNVTVPGSSRHVHPQAARARAVAAEDLLREDVSRAELARQLGISRATLYRRLSQATRHAETILQREDTPPARSHEAT